MKRAAFFFGAGISKLSGKPLASDITHFALKDEWHRTTEGRFCPGPKPNPHHLQCVEDHVTPLVQQFLAALMEIASDYVCELSRSRTSRKVHYEDLFSLAEQASHLEDDPAPNLAVVEFLRRLRRQTGSIYGGFEGGPSGGKDLVGLVESTCDFLHWVVHHKLTPNEKPRLGLKPVTDTATVVDELDIFSLNHDVLVEDQLRAKGFDLEDGFSDQDHGEFRAFSGWSQCNRQKVRLFKLHGSISWYLYDFPLWTSTLPARRYAIPLKGRNHSRDQHNTPLKPVDVKAAFLTGSVVKERRYGAGLFGELFTEFRRHLGRHKHLICCGYGFGDTGINKRIHQWLCDSLDGSNKLVVLNTGPEETFFEDKSPWMLEMKSQGRLVLIDKWLQCCKLSDLNCYFDDID